MMRESLVLARLTNRSLPRPSRTLMALSINRQTVKAAVFFFFNLTLRDKSFQRAFFSSSKKNSDRTSSDVEVRKSSSALRAVRQHNYASKVILKQEICIQCKTRYVFLVEIGL